MSNTPYDFGDDDITPLHDDPRFDAWIARQAANVNLPSATPREEMWTAIRAAQPATYAIAPRAPRALPFRRRSWRMPATIAAALLAGVGVERFLLTRDGAVAERSTAAHVTSRPPVTVATTAAAPSDSQKRVATPSTSASEPASSGGTPQTRASSRIPATRGPTRVAGVADTAAVSRLYRLAAEQTFTQAEALLTAYRAANLAARDSVAARQLGTWGRDVLSSTRLLLDSPAGADPQLRALLNDLELVLVQIVRLSGAPLDASDRAVIDRALHGSDLLPRLRTAVPAGAASTTSDE